MRNGRGAFFVVFYFISEGLSRAELVLMISSLLVSLDRGNWYCLITGRVMYDCNLSIDDGVSPSSDLTTNPFFFLYSTKYATNSFLLDFSLYVKIQSPTLKSRFTADGTLQRSAVSSLL